MQSLIIETAFLLFPIYQLAKKIKILYNIIVGGELCIIIGDQN